MSTLAGLAGVGGSVDGIGSVARFYDAEGVAVDSAGNVYVAETLGSTIRKVTPGGLVTTLAGSSGDSGSTDGTGSSARFNHPLGVAVDSAGNVYVADTTNNTIRKVTPNGLVTTLAGSTRFVGGEDGTTTATFNGPQGVAVDSAGDVFVADTKGHTIRRITPGGVVSTLRDSAGFTGNSDGSRLAANFGNPTGVAVDSAGNVYVADTLSKTIWVARPDASQISSPSLQIVRSTNRISLTWSVSATGFALESASSLSPGTSWTPILAGITTNADQAIFLTNPSGSAKFFRLRGQ